MNKVMTTALIAGGLLLMNSPEAAAHKDGRYSYEPPAHNRHYYGGNTRRSEHMPRWLKRNHSFRNWYRHSSLKRNRRIEWSELFEVYRWEHRYHDRRYERRYDRDYHSDHFRDDNRGHRRDRHRRRH